MAFTIANSKQQDAECSYDKVALNDPNVQYEHDERRKKKIEQSIGLVVIGLIMVILSVGIVYAVKHHFNRNAKVTARKSEIALLISLDGFKPEYLRTGLTPNLDKLADNGVKADSLIPVFPTKTFPNHYSIVTGLYPESHGIVSNSFFDEDRSDRFGIGKPTSFKEKWWGGEPIWKTAMKNGLKAASYFWVGSEALHPTYWRKYNKTISWLDRIDQVIAWMKIEKPERPSLITLYFEQPDSVSHKYGPFSQQVNGMVKVLDSTIGNLVDKLHVNGLDDIVSMIIVSDHGMTSPSCEKIIELNSLTNKTDQVDVVGLGASSFFYMKDEYAGNKSELMDDLQCKDSNLLVYDRTGVLAPKRWHYQLNKKIGDIFLVPKDAWSILLNKTECRENIKGAHGYDNIDQQMQATFIASGPAFYSGINVPPFQAIEIYNLLADLLDIPPAPNNGTRGSLNHILKKEYHRNFTTSKSDDKPKVRMFPDNFNEILSNCTTCVCPYCHPSVFSNLTYYRKNLKLSPEEVTKVEKIQFPWGVPRSGQVYKDIVELTQEHYILGFDTSLHIPMWEGHVLTKEQLATNIRRKNCFRQDVRVSQKESSLCTDFQRSGFDRGHFAPSGDFNFHDTSLQDTFILTNVVPQYPNFNRGIWLDLENLSRKWATKFGSIYTITGAIFDMDDNGIVDDKAQNKNWVKNLTSRVAIPTHFYKILTKCHDGNIKIERCGSKLDILTFILPHTKEKYCKLDARDEYLRRHIASVRDVELLTGLEFFTELPRDDQAKLKTQLNVNFW